MPLINSSFAPGQAQATVDAFQDPDQRQIAQAELFFQDARRNVETLRSFICRTKISACACPQDFCILFPILRWEIHLLPGWDFETSRNAFVLQKKL